MPAATPFIPPSETSYIQTLVSQPPTTEPPALQRSITTLSLQPHIEGGYFAETDRDPLLIPNPFQDFAPLSNATATSPSTSTTASNQTRHASTTIFYLLGQRSPVGHFHRNRGRTVHTLHRGRGRYVLIHADRRDESGRVPVETFVVGQDVAAGERLQWIVEGGKFKASFLIPLEPAFGVVAGGEGGGDDENGLLISETVVPGFDYADHDFMTAEAMVDLLGDEERAELRWLLRQDQRERLDQVVKDKKGRS